MEYLIVAGLALGAIYLFQSKGGNPLDAITGNSNLLPDSLPSVPFKGTDGVVDPSLSQTLADYCEQYQVPFGVAVGWVLEESGGKITSTGLASISELGYFQISAEESGLIANNDHARLATDPSYSLEAGLQLMNVYKQRLLNLTDAVPEDSEFMWRLVKLYHAAGAGAAKITIADAYAKGSLTDWDSFAAQEANHSISGKSSGYMAHWIQNVDKVFQIGAAYGPLGA